MKKLSVIFLFLFFCGICHSQPFDYTNPPLQIRASDNSISLYPWQLNVDPGSLYQNADGTAQLSMASSSVIVATFLKLNCSNGPLTGNLEISKADPEYRITDTGDNEYSRWTLTDTAHETKLLNRCDTPAGTGKALLFDGTTAQYVSFTDITTLGTTYSAMCWFKFTDQTQPDNIIAGTASLAAPYMIDIENDTFHTLYHNVGGGSYVNIDYTPDNNWHHIAVTRNGLTVKIYIDSVQTGGDLTLPADTSYDHLDCIGRQSTTGFNGTIDDLAIFSRVLSSTEISNAYNGSAGVFSDTAVAPWNSGLVALWRMDELVGVTVADSSGNGHTGTNTGGASITTGKVPSAPTATEVQIISCKDGVTSPEDSTQTFGSDYSKTILNGLTTHFSTMGTEGIYIDEFQQMVFPDNFKIYFGTGKDASIWYDGTNLDINPQDVGTGFVNIQAGGLSLTAGTTTWHIFEGDCNITGAVLTQNYNVAGPAVTGIDNATDGVTAMAGYACTNNADHIGLFAVTAESYTGLGDRVLMGNYNADGLLIFGSLGGTGDIDFYTSAAVNSFSLSGANATLKGSGVLSAGADTDTTHILGRAKIGNLVGINDIAGFSHYDCASLTDYALIQTYEGVTTLNSKTGKDLAFRINNQGVGMFTYQGNFLLGGSAGTELNANPGLYQFGTLNGTAKYVYWKLDDTDDYYNLNREDTNVLGLKVNMPMVLGTYDITASNLVNNAKSETIECLNNIIGVSYIKGLWVFDQTGATTSITDRSPNAHTLTLSGNASTFSPTISGLAPALQVSDSSHYFSVGDSNDFSFGDGATDSPFSIIALVNPTSVTASPIICKSVTGNYEWAFRFENNLLYGSVLHADNSEYLYRYYNSSLAADIGSWHVYIMTYDGSSVVGGIKIYRDGVQIDDSSIDSGSYVAMTNGTSDLYSWYQGTAVYGNMKDSMIGVISKELSAPECKRISDRLRAYAGTFI